MRKAILLLAVMALLVTGCNGGSDQRELYTRPIRGDRDFDLICINGYQYLLYRSTYYNAGGLTQMWERTPNGPRPMQCEPQEKSTTIEVPQPRNTQ